MCTPNNNPYVGLNDVTQGNLIIDASVLALNQSFANNNPYSGPNMDQILLYGSIQQEARGPIGGGTLNADVNGKPTSSNAHTGYGKFYTYDPRLELVSPPSYLNPTDGSYALASSAVTGLDGLSELAPADELLLERSGRSVHTSLIAHCRASVPGPSVRPLARSSLR